MSKEAALAAAGVPAPSSPGLAPANLPPQESRAPAELDSSRFAKLAQKETEIVRARLELKKEQEAVLAEKERFKPIWERHKAFEETKSKDPIAALKMLGFSETDVINFMAAEAKPEQTSEEKAIAAAQAAADERIKVFEESQSKKIREEQQERDNKAIQGYKSTLSDTVEKDKDKYEYCAHYGSVATDLAYELAEQIAVKSEGKEVISAQEAIQMVEDYYEEQDKLMSSLKKRQPKTETPPAKPAEPDKKVTPGFPNAEQPKPTLSRTRTLTNSATASVASTRQKLNESKEQKRERLMNILRNGK